MPTTYEAIQYFLNARRPGHNAPELLDSWSSAMETQVLCVATGEPVEGKRNTWTDGEFTWHHIRIPRDADSEPNWRDYPIGFPIERYALAVGSTGWNWRQRRSIFLGFDFDALVGHASGLSPERLEEVRQAAVAWPHFEVRRSTGGAGLHLYVRLGEGFSTANHTEHAALGRAILAQASAKCGHDFSQAVDICGGNMWLWHRKMTRENRGLELIKQAERVLELSDLPNNWRDHVAVVSGKRRKVQLAGAADDFHVAQSHVPLDDTHREHIEFLAGTGAIANWVPDHHLLQTHTAALKQLHAEGGIKGAFETVSAGTDLASANCFCFPIRDGAWKVFRFGRGATEAPSWTRDEWTWCYFNRPDAESASQHGLLEIEGRNDAANARRFAEQFGDDIRWCEDWKCWLVWDGRRWVRDAVRAIDALAKKYAVGLWGVYRRLDHKELPDKLLRDVKAFIRATNSAAGIANLLALARSEPGIPIRQEELDSDLWKLNCLNGTVDLKAGKLNPHERTDYITKICPVPYDETAVPLKFFGFVKEILADSTALMAFIQRWGGYMLQGTVTEQKLFVGFGTGANGKTTLFELLLWILGDYGWKATARLLMAGRDQHPTERAALRAKRGVVVSETNENGCLDEAAVKELTGADRLTARRLYENLWEFSPSHKLMLMTNHRPTIRGNDNAIWRRILMVRFGVTIPESEQNRNLRDELMQEAPGVLAWLVRGCLSWQAEGLKPPKEVEQATAEYRASEDVFGGFIAECCDLGSDKFGFATELLDAYRDHTGDDISPKRFASLLRGRSFKSGRASSGPHKGRSLWQGLGLRVNGEA